MSSGESKQTPKDIAGNVSDELKQAILDLYKNMIWNNKNGFAGEILRRLRVVSVDLEPMLVTSKKQAVVVSEIEVSQGKIYPK